jgi:putative hydrolase of the HAD superfamily
LSAADGRAASPVLLFDLGGVVVDFRGPERLHALVGGDVEWVRATWHRLPELDALERGRIAPERFADAFLKEWRLDLDAAAFLDEFRNWVVGRFEPVAETLRGLAGRHRLACLSNVNALHWARCVELGIDALFEAHLLSHELGLRKPEPEIYAVAAARLAAPPADIIFFDDAPANVAAARRAGMRAELVAAPGAAAAALLRAGVAL